MVTRIGSVLFVACICGCASEPPAVVHPMVANVPAAPSAEPDPPAEERPVVSASKAHSLAEIVRDGRKERLEPRSRQLLVKEIQSLESLFASMARTSPDRPTAMRRLAEGYVELEAAAARDKTQASDTLEREKAGKIVSAAQQSAVRHYTVLLREYPKCASPDPIDPAKGKGCPDDVLYYLGLEYERAGQLDHARKAYFDLIQNWSQSRFIPSAYLAFGELFFDQLEQDRSKLPLAEQSYAEVLKYPPPDNATWGYAQYKLGLVYRIKGEPTRQEEAFRKAVDFSTQYATLPGASALAEAARRPSLAR